MKKEAGDDTYVCVECGISVHLICDPYMVEKMRKDSTRKGKLLCSTCIDIHDAKKPLRSKQV